MTPDVTPVASSPTNEKRPPTPNGRRGGRTRRTRDAAPFASPARFSALVVALLAIGAVMLSVAISVGAVSVPLGTVWHSIAHHLGLTGPGDLILDQIV